MADEQWKTFLDQCLKHRIDANDFKNLSSLLAARCPVSESVLLGVLCDVRARVTAAGIKWDPLIPVYIDCLCKAEVVRISAVLKVLLKRSSIHVLPKPESQSPDGKTKNCYTLMTDIKVVQDVMLSVSTGHTPRTLAEVVSVFSAAVDWIQAVVAWHHQHQETGGLMSSPDVVSLFESLGILLAALSGTTKGLDVLSSDSHDGILSSPASIKQAVDTCRPQNQTGTGPFGLPPPLCRCISSPPKPPGQPAERIQSVWRAGVQVVGGVHDGRDQCSCAAIRGLGYGWACD